MVSPRADSRPYLFGSSAAASRGRRREASSGGARLPMRRRSGLRGRLVASALCVCLPAAAGWAKVSDKEALVSLYESTGGANWVMSDDAPYDEMLLPGGNHNWNLEEDPCDDRLNMSWHGVSCVDPCYYPIDGYDCAFGRITSLQLQFNNLEGTIPESLFDKLINLTVIDMSHNALSGTIPTTVGKLRNAMTLLLGFNQLSGTIPTEIRTMGTHIPPDENALTFDEQEDIRITAAEQNLSIATVQWEVENTMGLSQLDLAQNKLNGTIPTTIGELVNLQAVDVSNNPELGADGCCDEADSYYNSFYGYNTTVPTEMGMLKRLQVLKMDHSRFMRHMPTEIGNMRSLAFWRLKGSYETNQVSGTIPSEFGKLKKLSEFMMENNTLSGTIPNEITQASQLEIITVQDNKLSGTLPHDLGDLEFLAHWDSFGNKLEGDLPPSVQNLGSLEYLYIQNEHSDVIRNYYCGQRIEASAVGRKHNWQVLANEYSNYAMPGICANPLDVHQAFEALSGDV